MDEVNQDFRLCISEISVKVSDMDRRVFHKIDVVLITHGDNDLFMRWSLCSHLNAGFLFRSSFDYIVYLVNFFCSNGRKSFLNLDYICSTCVLS